MNAITNTAPGKLEWRQPPTPAPARGEVRIRTGACGVCATDLEMIAGWDRTGFPSVPGHEWSGTVDAVGPGVDPALVGRRTVAENVLADGGEVGFEHSGGYGEYLITQAANLHPLPDDLPLVTAALIEPLAVCVRAMRRLELDTHDAALVMGDGVIGLLMLALLKRAGVREIHLAGGRPKRLAIGAELGAARTINYHEAGGTMGRSLTNAAAGGCATSAGGYPVVAECSGSADALAAGMSAAAKGGRLLLVGDYKKAQAQFPWNRMIHGELRLIGSNASAGAWPEAVKLVVRREIPLERLVTHRLPARRFSEAMELARSCREAIKVVLCWDAATVDS